ncbi:MAG: hypothetical protein JW818_03070 [Pirellulales bacterium]|nr:hypothetical protein [Pirellulales bacterium]
MTQHYLPHRFLPLLFSIALTAGLHAGEIPFPEALDRAAIAYEGLQRINHDALIIGNGDLAGLIWEKDGGVAMKISKNDVWDARLDTRLDPPLPRFERVKELGRSGKRFPKKGKQVLILEKGVTHPGTSSYSQPYPCPRACGIVQLTPRTAKSDGGQDKKPVRGTVDLRRAVARVERVGPAGESAEFRALANRNAFLIRTTMDVRLIPPTMKGAKTRSGKSDDVEWFEQTLPGDVDWPGMTFAVAMRRQGEYCVVAVGTSREGVEPRALATVLLGNLSEKNVSRWINQHEATWANFWSASGVELDDPLFGRMWYQQLYLLRCAIKPDALSPGLYIGAATDPPLWHGDYHLNANIQGLYWTTLVTNHVDLMMPYHQFALDLLPRAKWLARKVFDMDGAFYPLTAFAYEPPPEKCKAPNGRQYFHHEWGFTIGITSFVVQPLWLEYQYTRDQNVLKRVYPVIREVAVFQSEFIDRCPEGKGGKVLLGPSVSPEHRGWTPGLKQNYNSTFDIALFRLAFEAAIESATTLGRDAELVERWRRSMARLPDHPTSGGPEPVVLDMKDARPTTFNLAPQMTPVWPAGQVTWMSPPAEVKLFRRTLQRMNWGKIVAWAWYCQYRVRLHTPDAFEWTHEVAGSRYRPNGTFLCTPEPHPFNDMGYAIEIAQMAMVISEMLMQSAGDVVYVFPVWPKDRDAAFRDLRAQGGFLVSARQRQGKVIQLIITSTLGGPLRLRSPWPTIIAKLPDGTSRQLTPDARGIVEMPTTRGQKITFHEQ